MSVMRLQWPVMKQHLFVEAAMNFDVTAMLFAMGCDVADDGVRSALATMTTLCTKILFRDFANSLQPKKACKNERSLRSVIARRA